MGRGMMGKTYEDWVGDGEVGTREYYRNMSEKMSQRITELEHECERLVKDQRHAIELYNKSQGEVERLRSALKREALFLRDCVTRWSGEYAGIGKAELATVVERLEQALPT
jgi:hypothetical protein